MGTTCEIDEEEVCKAKWRKKRDRNGRRKSLKMDLVYAKIRKLFLLVARLK